MNSTIFFIVSTITLHLVLRFFFFAIEGPMMFLCKVCLLCGQRGEKNEKKLGEIHRKK